MPTTAPIVEPDLLHSVSSSLGDGAGGLLGGALASGALWALMGAVAGLIAAAVIWRRGLLHRRPIAWNVLAKFSYLLVLVTFIGGAAGVGAVRKVQTDFDFLLTEQIKPTLTAKMPSVRAFLAARLSEYAPDKRSARDIAVILMEDLRYVPKSDTTWERTKAYSVNWFVRKFGTDVIIEQCQKVVIAKLDALGVAMKADFRGRAQSDLVKFGADLSVMVSTDATRSVDYTMLDKTVPEALVEVVQKTADGYFKSAFKAIGLVFALAVLIVGAEMLVYFKWHLARHQRETVI